MNHYKEPLETLDAQLSDAQTGSDDAHLAALQTDTKQVLAEPNLHAALAEHESFRERLEHAVERYGVSHPELTRAAQHLLDVLVANGL